VPCNSWKSPEHRPEQDTGHGRCELRLEWLPEVRVGEYVIVHVGFAISKLDEKDALETLKLLKEMGDIDSELGEKPDAGKN
jgi:hydrogenase expression/formation protein HypC